MFEGQLLYNLYSGKEKYLRLFYTQMGPVLENAGLRAKSHEWSSEKAKEEYMDILSRFSKKIKEETA
jgi:hypothetical protein